MKDCVMAFPRQVSVEFCMDGVTLHAPTRMKEKPMQVPATALTMLLSDILVRRWVSEWSRFRKEDRFEQPGV